MESLCEAAVVRSSRIWVRRARKGTDGSLPTLAHAQERGIAFKVGWGPRTCMKHGDKMKGVLC